MTMLLAERLRDLATQTHLLEEKVNALGWMAANGAQTLKSMTRAQAHLMLAECDPAGRARSERKEGGQMNSITVHAASSKLNPYNISIETTMSPDWENDPQSGGVMR